jgi:Na+/H+-translocating membrane pyrophosphatase
MELSNLLPPVFGVFGLAAAAYTYAQVKKYPEGEGKVVEIGNQIHLGAMVFMKREYKMLAIFSSVLLVLPAPEGAEMVNRQAILTKVSGYFSRANGSAIYCNDR